ncbi:peptidase inhibitor family I36 protein [Actinomadura sp. 9N215]|uniref:peptidase inhibitor family I36 protein n=1 Tax=Actinomadura sp. 9N215 TaxID=3375150 RepID=UPI003789B79B
MLRKLAHISLAASAAGALALLPAANASAATTSGVEDCPLSSFCGWNGVGFTGTMTTFGKFTCTDAPFPVRSIHNNYPIRWELPISLTVWSGKDCTGERLGSVSNKQSLRNLPSPGLSASVRYF